jgi:hypothetical protein
MTTVKLQDMTKLKVSILQCPPGMYSAAASPDVGSCKACPAGKVLGNTNGGIENRSCVNVRNEQSIYVWPKPRIFPELVYVVLHLACINFNTLLYPE